MIIGMILLNLLRDRRRRQVPEWEEEREKMNLIYKYEQNKQLLL